MTVIRVRISRRRYSDVVWTLLLLAVITAGLDALWHPLAIGFVLVVATVWIATLMSRSARR